MLASGVVLGGILAGAVHIARAHATRFLALAGLVAYAIASFSYTDNRSSTYLLLYVALPVLMIVALWLELLVSEAAVPLALRRGGLVVAAAAGALLLAAAWPAIGPRFSRTALAHAYPGGGLRAALHRLKTSPYIDPRTPVGVDLVERYVPGREILVVMPTGQDLALEILMHARRSSVLFVGDPNMDGFVPQVWMPIIARQIAALAPGTRLLTDAQALRLGAYLHAHPNLDPAEHPLAGGAGEEEWILQRLLARFRIRVLRRGQYGLVAAELTPPRG